MKNQEENKKVKIKYLDKRVAFMTLALALGIGSCSLMDHQRQDDHSDIPSYTIATDSTETLESSSSEPFETMPEESSTEVTESSQEETEENNTEVTESSQEETKESSTEVTENNQEETKESSTEVTESSQEETKESSTEVTESSQEETKESSTEETENSKEETEQSSSKETEENKDSDKEEIKHEHHFENWKSMDDEQEQGLCSCGEVRTQLHHNIIKNITNIPNQDATYNEVIEYQCTNCGHVLKKSTIKDCVFGEWKYNPETKREERTCRVSGYLETRKHEHQFGNITKVDDTYEYRSCNVCNEEQKIKHQLKKTVNSDGTIIYECENPECNYYKTEQPTHYHNYDQFLRYEGEKEYWGCECGKETTKSHTLGKETIDKTTHEVVQKCTTPGCNYEKRMPHTNHHNQFLRYEGEAEYWGCKDCGKEVTKNHTLGKETIDKVTHEVVQECTTPGCSYEKRTPHTNHHNQFLRYEGEIEYWECLDCGKEVTKNHTLGKETIDKKTHEVVQECTTPGCSYEKRMPHTNHHNQFLRYDGEIEYWECLDCGKEITKQHTLDQGILDKKTHEVVQKCTTPECSYEKRREHTPHQPSVFLNYVGPVENWECECGMTLTKNHSLGTPYIEEGTLDKVTKCTTVGCNYEERILHNTKDNPHVYELDRANTDEEKETWKCACGDSYTQGHRYNDGVAQPDGTYLQTCETCGETRNHHTCIKGDPEMVYIGTPTECYKIVYNCKICGEYVTEDAPVAHRLYTSGGKKKCRNWGCTYTEELTSGANEFYEEPSIETTYLPEKMKIKMIEHIHNN